MVKGFTQPRMRAQADSELHTSAAKQSLKRGKPSKAAPVPNDAAELLDEVPPSSPQTPSKKKPKAMVQNTSFEITKELRAKVTDLAPRAFK